MNGHKGETVLESPEWQSLFSHFILHSKWGIIRGAHAYAYHFPIAKFCICVHACYEVPVFCHGFSVYMLTEDTAMASISKDGYDQDQSS